MSDYQDGFADGFSRAWRDCWELINKLSKPPTGPVLDRFQECVHGVPLAKDCDRCQKEGFEVEATPTD